jgi:hypothetical protein
MRATSNGLMGRVYFPGGGFNRFLKEKIRNIDRIDYKCIMSNEQHYSISARAALRQLSMMYVDGGNKCGSMLVYDGCC